MLSKNFWVIFMEMHKADVVIIGGGIVGSSIAWHLTHAGCKSVLVIERESAQGKGSTGKSMGGVRAQFATPVNIQMSLYSIPFYARFEEVVGNPADYRAQGYLFLATVDPYSVMNGFMAGAAEHGATLWKKTEVTTITRHHGGAYTVATTRGPVNTSTVVNAAGAWSAQVAKFIGIDLPVEPLRRMLVPSEPFSDFPHSSPMVIDMSTGFHFRPEGRGFLLAWNDPEERPGYKTEFEPSFIEKILIHAANRVPAFENLPVNPKRAWAGLYEMTPDHHCVLGPVAGVPGFFLANGFSGHGVMHSPATGKILADLILHGTTNVVDDVSVLGFGRFASGKLLHETAVL